MKSILPRPAWAMKRTGEQNTYLIISYSHNNTKHEAIKAFERHTGTKWKHLVKQGFKAVKIPLYEAKVTKRKRVS